jgi:DivIVA domain-containing protein
MGVDQTSLDRIRNATFPSSRRGYDKHEVEKFLARLADWLETGGGDESRSDAVKRELERVGERTGAILSQAEDSAQQIRAEAEEEARTTINEANAAAEKARSEADTYATQTRTEADTHAEETRTTVEAESNATRARIEREVGEALDEAHAKARRIVEEGTRRREDIESVIADLVRRRDEVLGEVDELSARLDAAVGQYRPEGDDPFAKPDDLDPEAGARDTEPHPGPEGAEMPEVDAEETVVQQVGPDDEPGDRFDTQEELLAEDAAVEGDEPGTDEQETAERPERGARSS